MRIPNASETLALQSVHADAPASRILKVLWRELQASKREQPRGIFVGSTA